MVDSRSLSSHNVYSVEETVAVDTVQSDMLSILVAITDTPGQKVTLLKKLMPGLYLF